MLRFSACFASPCPNHVTKWIFTGEMYPRFTMILDEPILDPAVFEHNSVKYSPFSPNNTSTPWSGIGVKLEYVMCEHWFIESLRGNIEQNFSHMIRNTLRHIVKLVVVKQSLLMDVISKPESLLRQDCDYDRVKSLVAIAPQWRAISNYIIMARTRLLHVLKLRNRKRGGSVSNRGVVCPLIFAASWAVFFFGF